MEMDFRTELILPGSGNRIEHHHKIFTIGSCFAENMSDLFSKYKFRVMGNPFGVLYNVVSVHNALESAVNQKRFVKEDLVFDQEEWHSLYHHSDFSHHNADECITRINESVKSAFAFLKDADIVIITYGTSFVYRHKEKDIIVSNCHKIPAVNFEKILLSIDETKKQIKKTIDIISALNPKVRIIFTVSPVRHLKDGFAENNLSKSILIAALNEVLPDAPNAEYFPSYEIVMDDLRDYRFYGDDLVHPNKTAVEYIWQKFSDRYFSRDCVDLINEIKKIVNARNHRVRNHESVKYKEFAGGMLKKISDLNTKYGYINLSEEKDYFENEG